MTEPYARGPSPRSPHRGPVEAVYADTGCLERDCPDCGVKAGEYCIWVDPRSISKRTVFRRTPCGGRIQAAEKATT